MHVRSAGGSVNLYMCCVLLSFSARSAKAARSTRAQTWSGAQTAPGVLLQATRAAGEWIQGEMLYAQNLNRTCLLTLTILVLTTAARQVSVCLEAHGALQVIDTNWDADQNVVSKPAYQMEEADDRATKDGSTPRSLVSSVLGWTCTDERLSYSGHGCSRCSCRKCVSTTTTAL